MSKIKSITPSTLKLMEVKLKKAGWVKQICEHWKDPSTGNHYPLNQAFPLSISSKSRLGTYIQQEKSGVLLNYLRPSLSHREVSKAKRRYIESRSLITKE